MSKLTEQEAYRVLAKASGIKAGDKVRILRAAKKDYECGSNTMAAPCKKRAVGCLGTVKESGVDEQGDVPVNIDATGNWHWFPWFVLEIVETAPRKISLTITDEYSAESKTITVSEQTAISLRKNLDELLEK